MCPANDRQVARFCVAAFSMDFAVNMALVSLPYLALSMGASSFDLGVLGASRGAAYVIACVSGAWLADRKNRKALIAVSTTGLIISLLAIAASRAFWQLVVTGICLFTSLSLFWPSVMSWVGDAHSAKRLAPATAAFNLSWSVGAMLGAFVGGWLFLVAPSLPALAACAAIVAACSVMVTAPARHAQPQPPRPTPAVPGTKRELVGAWLGNVSACSLLGLMSNVFPKFGQGIGINAMLFGMLIAILGIGRSLVFLWGMKRRRTLESYKFGALCQIVAALLTATLFRASANAWLIIVFAAVGLNMGVAYYRALYQSLENERSRGMKSGVHEATLLLGALLGSFGGGAIAQGWGVRTPYPVFGLTALLLVSAQVLLATSAKRARKNAAPIATDSAIRRN